MAMGRRYVTSGQTASDSPSDTLLVVTGGTTIRPFIYDFFIGSSATPADNSIIWTVQRTTAAGTSTAVVAAPLDPADPAATATTGKDCSAEPTYTAATQLFYLPLNQRASWRWIADPNGPMTVPATGSNGLGLFPTHASFTGNVEGTIHFAE
jgi:hypothetical protein